MAKSRFHISVSERKLFLRVFDVFWIFVALYFAHFFYEDFFYFNFKSPQILIWSLTLIIYLSFFSVVFELYELKVASDGFLSFRSVLLAVVFTSVFYILTPVFSPVLPENRIQLLMFFLMLLVGVGWNRFIYIQFIYSPVFRRNTLVIGHSSKVQEVLDFYNRSTTMVISAYVSERKVDGLEVPYQSVEDCNIQDILLNSYITEILISSKGIEKNEKYINEQLINLFEAGISIKSIDSFLESRNECVSDDELHHDFFSNFKLSSSHENNLYLAFKRLLDILFSLFGICVMLCLIPIVFIGNLIGNFGPMFYVQKRVGIKGKKFTIVKFRTMVASAEKGKEVWATKNDVRITRFGRLLRKTRIDEVPQFLNVFFGSMSFIGPRPERPGFVKELSEKIPFYSIRHVVKPGLTGWAQVKHPYANSVDDQHKKLLFDLYYIKKRNLLLDFKIVLKTISTIIFMRGT